MQGLGEWQPACNDTSHDARCQHHAPPPAPALVAQVFATLFMLEFVAGGALA